jgi:hypothetical protein
MARPDLYGMPETDASKLQGDNDVLRAINEELVEALKTFLKVREKANWDDDDMNEAEHKARAVIARAKEEEIARDQRDSGAFI